MDTQKIEKLYELLERAERERDAEAIAVLRWVIFNLENCTTIQGETRKAALIIELPENCRDCPYFAYHCKLTNKKCNFYSDNGRHESCPLYEITSYKDIF